MSVLPHLVVLSVGSLGLPAAPRTEASDVQLMSPPAASRSRPALDARRPFAPGGGTPLVPGPNLIVNGDFEDHTGLPCQDNLSNDSFNLVVANATAFGGAQEIDVYSDPAGCYGLPAISGSTKVALHSRRSTGGVDAFSFDLSAAVTSGASYTLSFWVQTVTDFDPQIPDVEVGLSNSPTSFGALVYTATPPTPDQWRHFSTTFVAPVDATWLTVRVGQGGGWDHVDGFTLLAGVNPEAYCFCPEAIAPCGNTDLNAGCENSSGQGALLATTGTTSVVEDDLFLVTTQGPTNRLGLYFMGSNQVSLPFGAGVRCVGGTVKRFNVPLNSGASGSWSLGPVVGFSLANFPPAFRIASLSTWNFQLIYRDPTGPCQQLNASNGLSVFFTP